MPSSEIRQLLGSNVKLVSVEFLLLGMKVILLRDIEKLGKKFDVKEVANGHALNFLIPKGMVKKATEETLEWLRVQKEILEKKATEELKRTQDFATSIDGQEVMMQVKIGEEGQLFESITAQKIAEKMKEMGFEIKKNQIELLDPIKELGEFPIKIKFEHNLEAEIKLIITEEK